MSKGTEPTPSTRKPEPWRGHILITPEFKPGDLPPEGYLAWHEWADVQRKAGIKQVECPTCARWRTPQELSTHEVNWVVLDRRGREIRRSAFECSTCFTKRPQAANVTHG